MSADRGGAEAPPTDSSKLSRKERRAEKRRVYEARKKAREIDKANDRRHRVSDMKDSMNMEKAEKKANKGKHDKADKKANKTKRRRR